MKIDHLLEIEAMKMTITSVMIGQTEEILTNVLMRSEEGIEAAPMIPIIEAEVVALEGEVISRVTWIPGLIRVPSAPELQMVHLLKIIEGFNVVEKVVSDTAHIILLHSLLTTIFCLSSTLLGIGAASF
jgi:hypothetical protein